MDINKGLYLLYFLNFLFIGLLPRLFFRQDGTFNLKWWATASPFMVGMMVFLNGLFEGHLVPEALLTPLIPISWQAALTLISVPFSVVSISLIALTIGNHRVPLSLWHQDNDAPQSIVTWGAYRRIRHPFYAAFLLALSGAFLLIPTPIMLFLWGYSLILLNLTAAREEQKLSNSSFGTEYKAYMRETGRFLPKMGNTPHA